MYQQQVDPLHGFYLPFFETRKGQIFVLSAPKDHIRDGLAAIQIARVFPIPEYPLMTIEPSRPTVLPAENIIIVGRAAPFIEREMDSLRGPRPKPVGYSKLGERLERIARRCCYEFAGGSPLVLHNPLGDTKYGSQDRNDVGKEVDHGVIRRVYCGASENTVLLEGIHWLGTLGAALVATSPAHLAEIREAVSELSHFDPTLPLEVLVRATFDSSLCEEVSVPSAIEARPLNIVYNRKWIYDMQERRWVDQEPYELEVEACGENQSAVVSRTATSRPGSWLEVEADLRHMEAETRRLCRGLLRDRRAGSRRAPADEKQRDRLLSRLTAASDLFAITLHEVIPLGRRRPCVLPTNPSPIRLLRKRFLLHLILCLFLDARFVCDERHVAAHFPEINQRRHGDGKLIAAHFASTISGRMREGFLPLLGERDKPKQLLRILRDAADRSYRIHPERLRIVLRLRV